MIAKYLFLITIAIFLAGCGSGSSVFLSFENGEYKIQEIDKCPIPEQASQPAMEEVGAQDINLELSNNQITAYKDNQVFWQTEPDWQVDHLLVADADNDQEDEIILTLWKKGSFGKDLPFWLEENDQNTEHHLFLYKYQDGEIKAKWHSSSLARPILELFVFDINQDGKNELVELEGEYKNFLRSSRFRVGVWQWNEWVFENLWQSEIGNYSQVCP